MRTGVYLPDLQKCYCEFPLQAALLDLGQIHLAEIWLSGQSLEIEYEIVDLVSIQTDRNVI